jgi:hypothetical protein
MIAVIGGGTEHLHAGPATDEVEDQNDHGDNQKQVNEPAADAAEQAEKPENSDNDGYPKQHECLPCLSAYGNGDSAPRPLCVLWRAAGMK